MKYSYLILVFGFLFLYSCKNGNSSNDNIAEPEFSNEDELAKLPLDERSKKHAMLKLGIPANEKFSVQIHQAYLNSDNQSDAIITINRLEYAESYSAQSKNFETLKRNGYVGNFNYFMIYDGASNKLSIPVPVPSSAMKKLEVDFIYLFSESYATPVITYRIKNSEFKNFYNIADGVMDKVFKMISYNNAGEENEEAFVFEIGKEGTFSDVKDIIVYKGKLENSAEIAKDWFGAKTKISATKTVDKKWFFDPKRYAYVTPEY
ncbi:MAG: hypothetical protein J0G96_02620 [Flavobacteriia bacterium]|nr:hypothetical protein [Flavobacteriia bacterium]OJX37542.1 MAG: hypothetical protein BGO87_00850 [Flavobacteriia bacterium 40-80]